MNTEAEIHTRALEIADYATVLTLWHEMDEPEIAEGDSREEIRTHLERNPCLSRVATAGERIAGAALCGHDGRRGFIYHLAVAPDSRGRGIGKLLVDQCVSGLAAAGIAHALLLVAKDNPRGQAFWARNGWEAVPGAMVMGKDVA